MIVLIVVMSKYLKEIGILEIGPSMLSTDLPYMPPGDENKLTVSVGGLKVLNQATLSLAGNVLGSNNGNPEAVADFSGDSHIAIGVTEQTMRRVYDFWWNKSTVPKVFEKSDYHDFDTSLPGWVDIVKDWAVRIGTGGIFSQDVNLNYIRMSYDLKISFGKFGIDLRAGNQLKLSGSILIDFNAKVEARLTATTEVLTIDVDKTSFWKTLFDSQRILLPIDIGSATAEISTDKENRLVAKIINLDIDTPLVAKLPGFPSFTYNWLKDWIVEQVVSHLPPIPLYSAVIEQKVSGTNLTVEAKICNITTTTNEVLVGLKTKICGAGDNAPFVGNKSKEHMEIHKKDCTWIKQIKYENRVYYIDLEDALEDGFDGCKYCIKEHHTR